MNKPVFMLAGLLGLLTACASAPAPVAADGGAAQRRQLAESGARIADALAKLAVVEQASHRIHVQTINTAAEDAPEELRLRVAVDYQGDLKPFVYQLAQVVGYEVKTYGVSSVLTPINVQADDRAIGELLADAGYQASWRCQVVVDPGRRRVEILYDNRHPKGANKNARRRG